MDWDKLRIFFSAAQAGSFTHAGEQLEMSQSAVSRQVSALEAELGVPLFHRHARGLILTEQGDLLFRTAREVVLKLETVKTRLSDSRDKPSGVLRVTTTVGLGSTWLTGRLNEFMELYPEVQIELILDDLAELDLAMREADVAVWLRPPAQPDLIQRKLFTVHFHVYASPAYIKQYGLPKSLEELDRHRIVTFGNAPASYLKSLNWLEQAGRDVAQAGPRRPHLRINNILGIKLAVQRGAGIGLLPDYLVESAADLVRLFPETDVPSFDGYFVYPEEMKATARVKVFRDFLVSKAERWTY
jgi:DNA-binding transcriptional LysR family regulator